MNKKAVHEVLATLVFILFLPLIIIESFIIRRHDLLNSIVVDYQLLLFAVALGCNKR